MQCRCTGGVLGTIAYVCHIEMCAVCIVAYYTYSQCGRKRHEKGFIVSRSRTLLYSEIIKHCGKVIKVSCILLECFQIYKTVHYFLEESTKSWSKYEHNWLFLGT